MAAGTAEDERMSSTPCAAAPSSTSSAPPAPMSLAAPAVEAHAPRVASLVHLFALVAVVAAFGIVVFHHHSPALSFSVLSSYFSHSSLEDGYPSSSLAIRTNPPNTLFNGVCTGSGPCQNGSACVPYVSGTNYYCLCCAGYSGSNCSNYTSPCSPNPCNNSGTCALAPTCQLNGNPGYSCSCASGFGDSNCNTRCGANCSVCDVFTVGQPVCTLCTNFTYLVGGICYPTCPAGFVSNVTGLTNSTCADVNECLASPCLRNGTCINSPGTFQCNCTPGYTGAVCATDRYCGSNPCANGGVCTNTGFNYTCACPPAYTGPQCQSQTNFCISNPCLYGGTCTPNLGGRTCSCASGFSGTNCEVSAACQANPCVNGQCVPQLGGGYTCNCTGTGYTGATCNQIALNLCTPSTCQNGGTCNMIGVGVYSCQCVPGYNGTNCQNLIDNCSPNPCLNGSTCNNFVNAFNCSCRPGFTGTLCNLNATLCQANPCLNNGTCVPTLQNTRSCSCPFGYNGTRCENLINFCNQSQFANPCRNSGVCTFRSPGRYSCSCPRSWRGDNCEFFNACIVNASNSCLNGGACVPFQNSFNCSCLPGFFGQLCASGSPSTFGASTGGDDSGGGMFGIPYFILGIIAGCLLLTILLIIFLYRRYRNVRSKSRKPRPRVGDLHAFVNPSFVGFSKSGGAMVNENYDGVNGRRVNNPMYDGGPAGAPTLSPNPLYHQQRQSVSLSSNPLYNSSDLPSAPNAVARAANPLYDKGSDTGRAGEYEDLVRAPADGYLDLGNDNPNHAYDVPKLQGGVSAYDNVNSTTNNNVYDVAKPANGAYVDVGAESANAGYLMVGASGSSSPAGPGRRAAPAVGAGDAYLDLAGSGAAGGAYMDVKGQQDAAYLQVEGAGKGGPVAGTALAPGAKGSTAFDAYVDVQASSSRGATAGAAAPAPGDTYLDVAGANKGAEKKSGVAFDAYADVAGGGGGTYLDVNGAGSAQKAAGAGPAYMDVAAGPVYDQGAAKGQAGGDMYADVDGSYARASAGPAAYMDVGAGPVYDRGAAKGQAGGDMYADVDGSYARASAGPAAYMDVGAGPVYDRGAAKGQAGGDMYVDVNAPRAKGSTDMYADVEAPYARASAGPAYMDVPSGAVYDIAGKGGQAGAGMYVDVNAARGPGGGAGAGDMYFDVNAPKGHGANAGPAYLDVPSNAVYAMASSGAPAGSSGMYMDVNSAAGQKKKREEEGAYFDPTQGGAPGPAYMDVPAGAVYDIAQQGGGQGRDPAYDVATRAGGGGDGSYFFPYQAANTGMYADVAGHAGAEGAYVDVKDIPGGVGAGAGASGDAYMSVRQDGQYVTAGGVNVGGGGGGGGYMAAGDLRGKGVGDGGYARLT